MREELLGYLLSALEPHEMRAIDQRLRDDPQLREELAEVERMLRSVDASVADSGLAETPADLVARTIDFIAQSDVSGGKSLRESTTRGGVALKATAELRPRRERRLADVLVSGLAAATLLAMTFPTIQRFRDESRKSVCQDNLRQLGMALSQYVFSRGDSRLPSVAEAGAESFSGMYAIRLADFELLNDSKWLHCPSRDAMTTRLEPKPTLPSASRSPAHLLAGGPSGGQVGGGGKSIMPNLPHRGTPHLGPESPSATGPIDVAAKRSKDDWDVIRSEHIQAAVASSDYSLLRWIQRHAGGHFAYSLGVVDDSTYKPPRYEGRASFAVLGDAPIAGHQGTEAINVAKLRYSHGEGANLLFEDGSVRHVLPAEMAELSDHPYINHHGAMEAGTNIDDAVLAPSWVGPFPRKRQR